MLSLLPVLEFLYSSIRLQSIIVYVSNQMLRKTLCHTFLHPTFVHIIFVHQYQYNFTRYERTDDRLIGYNWKQKLRYMLFITVVTVRNKIIRQRREKILDRSCPEPVYPKLIKSSSRRLTSPCRANNFPPPSNPIPFLFGSHAWFSHRDKVISTEINYSSRGENANSPVGEGGNLYAACRADTLHWHLSGQSPSRTRANHRSS